MRGENEEVFRGHQPLLTAAGLVFLALFAVPLVVSLLLGGLEPGFWWLATSLALAGVAMLAYRCLIVFLESEIVISKGVWPISSLTTIPNQAVKELTLFGQYAEGSHMFSLWLTLANGKRFNLQTEGEVQMTHLEKIATELSERTGLPLIKDESFYRSAKNATNNRERWHLGAIICLVVAGVALVAALIFRLGAILGEGSALGGVASLYTTPFQRDTVGGVVEAISWILFVTLAFVGIGWFGKMKEPRK